MKRLYLPLPRTFALAFTWLALAPSLALAEDTQPDNPRQGWAGLGSASLALNAGSNDSATALLNLDLSRKLEHSKTSFLGQLNYGTALVDGKHQTTAGRWNMSLQQDRNINDWWFAFAKVGLDGDRSLQIKLRTKGSLGLGNHVINDEDVTLDVFGGFSYADRRYSSPQQLHNITVSHLRKPGGILGEESSHRLSSSITLKQRLEAYPDFSIIHAHTATFSGTLGISVTQRLSLSISLSSSYNRRVPEGVPRTDTSLFTGLSFKMGD
jgi:putative salt-induced outer membrane protein